MAEAVPFEPGEVIVHRDVYRGRIWYARAEVVAEDANDRVLLYWPPGAEVRAPVGPEGDGLRIPSVPWVLELRPWHSFHVLCHWFPGDHHSVWLYWEADTWRFKGWYVNLQSPFLRTPLGLDATDDILDVEIEPSGAWAWKDSDELNEAVRAGIITPSAAEKIRREGWRAVQRIEQAREPFIPSLIDWRPDDRWPVPKLPRGWESLPTPAK